MAEWSVERNNLPVNFFSKYNFFVVIFRFSEYIATFPEDENEGESFASYAMRDTLAGVFKMTGHGKTVRFSDSECSHLSAGLCQLSICV